MMYTVKDIYNFLDEFCPFENCLDFDNVGVLLGSAEDKVTKVLLVLDIVDEVYEEAQRLNANLIITHHPIIFNGLKKISSDSLICKLLKENINVISAHTNLDVAKNGVNFCLAKALNLNNLQVLSFAENNKNLPLGYIGDLSEPLNCTDFARFTKEQLNCKGLRYVDIRQKNIQRVAVGSGACGDLIYDAVNQQVDAFITGEIKYHEILYAKQNKVCVVDVGHYKSEDVVLEPLRKKLSDNFENIEFLKSQVDIDSINYV